jgi:hypothetical protein
MLPFISHFFISVLLTNSLTSAITVSADYLEAPEYAHLDPNNPKHSDAIAEMKIKLAQKSVKK